ncbi:MAG: cobalamin-dependent protein [Clostridia bacterium]|nr:cobalamin-dependent protein [Clostridia bacterium]
MKKVYFVQVGFEFDGSVYLPYAVGTIIAYCRSVNKINEEYEFSDIIFRREKLQTALDKISEPSVVGFSCSVWNMEYNKALARLVKEKYPQCFIVFGGHSAVAENLSEEYIDCVMLGEGEETFAQLLKGLSDGDISDVDNIVYKNNGAIVATERSCARNIENYPSAYLTGVFDKIVSENPEADFLAVLETNRGCPYTCSYCDWCSDKKMRFFSMEKVLAEIEWLSQNKIAYCFGADSNFGMFERDYDIALALVEAKKNTGYPEVFRPCYEKNSADRVFKICSTLNSVGMDKGATMAYQTLSEQALKNIGRKNLTMEHFSSLMKKYNEAGIPTYSELILGLPGETKESFCRGICRLFENGQHNSVSVYHCEMLPNAELSQKESVEKHGIETIKVAFNHIHSAAEKDEEVKEYSYLIRSTATMSREDWVYSNLFSVCVQCFHSLGILRFFAMYLRNEKNIAYYDFYTALLEYILSSDGKLGILWNGFKEKYENSLEGDWNYYNEKFGDVTWFFEEGAFLEIVNEYGVYLPELIAFLQKYDIEESLFNELLAYQRIIVRKPFDTETEEEFDRDFYSYFNNILKSKPEPLSENKIRLTVSPKVRYQDLPSFAKEVVWFGRRRGATIYGTGEVEKA